MTTHETAHDSQPRFTYYLAFISGPRTSTRFVSWHRRIQTTADVNELIKHLDQWVGPNTLLLSWQLLDDD